MESLIRNWEGEEWEKYIQLLLKRYYGPGNYQEIPAKHRGDFGIEGYSTDGCVYQCYAAQEPCTVKQRYDCQRDKITTDIGKFINNKLDLIKLFGCTIIHRWILVVPISESALLMQHASKKADEVLLKKLPYVSDDFKIIVIRDDCFAKEINELTNVGVLKIDVQNLEATAENIEEWLNSNDGLIKNLYTKAQKIPGLSCNDKMKDFKYSMINKYLTGQNLLTKFDKNFPDIYSQLTTCKRTNENHRVTMSLINDNSANKYLSEALNEYANELKKSVPTLPPSIVQVLSWEAIADWLMRCPLDF